MAPMVTAEDEKANIDDDDDDDAFKARQMESAD